ncbi:MAG: hypothetical protein ACRCYW_08655 [Aeromonas sp.]|uniref:hypothetical protein n=1 Tax=Aeromonas sp. TaxID=647 RepID=UPI003F40270E
MKIETLSSEIFKEHVYKRLLEFGGLATPGHIEYFKGYYGFDFSDLSFGVIYPGGEVLCLLTRHISDGVSHYSWYGQPVRIICRGQGDKQLRAEQVAQNHLYSLWKDGDIIDFQEPTGEMSFFAKTLLQMGVTPRIFPEQIINITSDLSMLGDMRKVFRQNIKWGERNLNCAILNKDNITEGDFDAFEQFHITVAGRRTRSHSTWRAQMKLVLTGENYLISSYLDNNLVGMSLFAASGERAYYSVGVYDRDLFNYPLSHYPIWRGILHAKNLGCKTFCMGESFYSGVLDSLGRIPSEKECNISYFKRGFGGGIYSFIRFLGNISV